MGSKQKARKPSFPVSSQADQTTQGPAHSVPVRCSVFYTPHPAARRSVREAHMEQQHILRQHIMTGFSLLQICFSDLLDPMPVVYTLLPSMSICLWEFCKFFQHPPKIQCPGLCFLFIFASELFLNGGQQKRLPFSGSLFCFSFSSLRLARGSCRLPGAGRRRTTR